MLSSRRRPRASRVVAAQQLVHRHRVRHARDGRARVLSTQDATPRRLPHEREDAGWPTKCRPQSEQKLRSGANTDPAGAQFNGATTELANVAAVNAQHREVHLGGLSFIRSFWYMPLPSAERDLDYATRRSVGLATCEVFRSGSGSGKPTSSCNRGALTFS